MKGFILGIIFTLVCIAAGAYIYFAGGYAPVATSAQAMPFEKMLAKKALDALIEKQAPKSVPIQADEAAYTTGAAVYKMNCAVCHGLPGVPPTPIAKGEYPKPPQLFSGHGVTDDPAGETYWKVANGIRLTGMPAFSQSLSETQMWQVSLLLKNADKLPASVQQDLGGGMQPQASTGRSAHQHDH
jgi:mono/diheme cytochrome c family protein